MERPGHDQLELLDGGLLRHHCAYPLCPLYLVCLATPADRVNGTRRGKTLCEDSKRQRHRVHSPRVPKTIISRYGHVCFNVKGSVFLHACC